MDVQVHESNELKQVNAVPEVLEVFDTILFHLHDFEKDQEALGHEAEDVTQVLNQEVFKRDR